MLSYDNQGNIILPNWWRPGRRTEERLSEPGSHLLLRRGQKRKLWVKFVRWATPPNALRDAGVAVAYTNQWGGREIYIDIQTGITFQGLEGYYLDPSDRLVLVDEAIHGGRKLRAPNKDLLPITRAKRKPGLLHVGKDGIVTKEDEEQWLQTRHGTKRRKELKNENPTTKVRTYLNAQGREVESIQGRRLRLRRERREVNSTRASKSDWTD